MTMVDLSTMLLSQSSASSGGTFRWMSPELLDPPRFGSSGRLTRESDCYALGMVIYEVGWFLASEVAHSTTPGSDWPPTVPPSIHLRTRSRCTERRASRKTS